MDTSEQYIKMCEKAFKVMYPDGEQMLLFDQTVLYWNIDKQKIIAGYEIWNKRALTGYMSTQIDHYFPLYRQDQLQEMILEDWYDRFDRFYSFFHSGTVDILSDMTLEQLWLAFVMKERYGKVWNGEEWIKED